MLRAWLNDVDTSDATAEDASIHEAADEAYIDEAACEHSDDTENGCCIDCGEHVDSKYNEDDIDR